MLVVEGFFGGLVAGKMGEAELRAGLKHSVMLVASKLERLHERYA
jgi:hypothetical protein